MKKVAFALTLFLAALQSQAVHAKPLEYKFWKTFESDYGYEFKYPDCWKVERNNAYDEGPLLESTDVIAEEDSCKTPKLDPELPNGVSFTAWTEKMDQASRSNRISIEKKSISAHLKNGDYLVSKELQVNGAWEMFVFVELHSKLQRKIRWEARLFCPKRIIEMSGSFMQDPDKALLEKFKKGELALPEPYKAIFDSVKCTRDKK